MHVIGTAGHVDHGKSSLVRALTGTNPDRWIEEQVRGMTLDLGFAHLRFEDGVEAGIVDVPGHERFLHNMLAGAAGMELLLLVVAANEGPRPQTLEHLAILNFLNVSRSIVALTKSDTVDDEEAAFTAELVRETVRGTVARDAEIVPVSTVTGAGLELLRAKIHDALVELPGRAVDAPAYLPIDRVFALSGHGTIVTGTLMQGRIAVGDQLVIQPSNKPARVRSLHVFGVKKDAVTAGSRVAANLPGLELAELSRGDVLSSPELEPRAALDVRFTPLAAALPLLKRRTAVRAYIGSAEILGRLVFSNVPATVAQTAATLHLRFPTVVFPGSTFVLRRLSPKNLLGGGVVAGAARSDDFAGAASSESAAVARVLGELGLAAFGAAKIAARANLREDVVERALAELTESGQVLRVGKPAGFVWAPAASELVARTIDVLRQRELEVPWTLGQTSLWLARALEVDESLLVRVLAAFAENGTLALRNGYYSTADFVPQLSVEQREFFERAVPLDGAQPYLPSVFLDVAAAVKTSKIAGLPQAFDTLLASGALTKVGDAVYRGTQIASVRAALEAHLRKEREITMAGFRDLVGTTRKYAVPLLEWFDATGVTVRRGDLRVLRNASARIAERPATPQA